MIEFIFTIDYEIYGNGQGSLKELVYDPAEKLAAVFRKWDARFVLFVEAAELEVIEAHRTDSAIELVKQQVRQLFKDGFEIGLHIHPQWYKGRHDRGIWLLDYSEYNLCNLPPKRIAELVDRSISYLRRLLGMPDFTPLSFRAGNWLFQPASTLASLLAERGIRVDSSVFKGGLQHYHNLDYRRALGNGYYWKFKDRVDLPDHNGTMLELPIYVQMVPPWRMFTRKRLGLQRKASAPASAGKSKFYRLLDLLRFRFPLKLDFCRMTIDELTLMLDRVVQEDQEEPEIYRPVVSIGHTKDLVDLETVESLMVYLTQRSIAVSTFKEVHEKCKNDASIPT